MLHRSSARCSSCCQATSLVRAALAAWYASRQQDTRKSAADSGKDSSLSNRKGPGSRRGLWRAVLRVPAFQQRGEGLLEGAGLGGTVAITRLRRQPAHASFDAAPAHEPAQKVASENRAVLATRGARVYQGSFPLRATDCLRSAHNKGNMYYVLLDSCFPQAVCGGRGHTATRQRSKPGHAHDSCGMHGMSMRKLWPCHTGDTFRGASSFSPTEDHGQAAVELGACTRAVCTLCALMQAHPL